MKRRFRPGFSDSKSDDAVKAFNRVVRLLYRRDHSVQELREKLNPYYEEAAVEAAIIKAEEFKYLKDPQELAEQFARHLHAKNKGYMKICFELKKKGLPEVDKDPDLELEKARTLLEKLLPADEASLKDDFMRLKVKAQRHLQNKGYDFDTIRQALSEKF